MELNIIDKQIKKQFKSWAAFAELQGESKYNFKRKIMQNIDRLNRWLEPAELQIQIVLKKRKSEGKK